MCARGQGVAGNRDQRKTAPHSGHQGPAAAGVLCSVVVRTQVGGGDVWAWGKGWGQWEQSCPVPEGNRSSVRKHVAQPVTAPPLRTPVRCPLLPPSPARWAGPSAGGPGLALLLLHPQTPPHPRGCEGGGIGLTRPHHSLHSLALQKGDESRLSVWVTQQPPQPSFIHKKRRNLKGGKKNTHAAALTQSQVPLPWGP